MGRFRRASSSDNSEAFETQVVQALDNGDGTLGITFSNISTWADECDFITYSRDVNTSEIDEQTRIVWTGVKVDNTHVTATRVGGTAPDNQLDGSYFGTVVPTHFWANNIVEALTECLPDDGENGIRGHDGNYLSFIVSPNQPSPVQGRTIVWFRPIN